MLLHGVAQGSTLPSNLFKVCINDMMVAVEVEAARARGHRRGDTV